ncbi:DUF488 domain-containing protein [Chryseobacterium mulctrae]|uniref:DUF488 domain-containing protein n=1 Tax=Chryseobacterium mulctrae TaxID=2576777 RepID=UPI0011174819|nr:DUF488 family protein [Chryseobacterium mulctrae]
MKIKLKRIYEAYSPTDGYRVLVDRLWPRGISRENAHIEEWNKELAPSSELRKWFHHDPKLWKSFSEKYEIELKEKDAGKEFLDRNKKQDLITLVYGAKDEQHCHPLILKKYLENLILGDKIS